MFQGSLMLDVKKLEKIKKNMEFQRFFMSAIMKSIVELDSISQFKRPMKFTIVHLIWSIKIHLIFL